MKNFSVCVVSFKIRGGGGGGDDMAALIISLIEFVRLMGVPLLLLATLGLTGAVSTKTRGEKEDRGIIFVAWDSDNIFGDNTGRIRLFPVKLDIAFKETRR